jgi:hypothetical protein
MGLLEPLVAASIISNLARMLKTIHFKDQISAADKEVGDDERARAIENSLPLEGDAEALEDGLS